jgi:hypothetical protein
VTPFNAVALVVAVFELTGSGVKVSGTVIMEIVPVLALGFVAGTIVDRQPRRRVMIAADLGRAAIAGLLALAPDHLWTIYPAAFGLCSVGLLQPRRRQRPALPRRRGRARRRQLGPVVRRRAVPDRARPARRAALSPCPVSSFLAQVRV